MAVLAAAFSAGCTSPPAATPDSATPVALYEGARLIRGDGSAAIESAAFTVQRGVITRVGRKGEVSAPPHAMRIDLTGKTVMPTLLSAHVFYHKDAVELAVAGVDSFAHLVRDQVMDDALVASVIK